MRKARILLAKVGLDGHDRGILMVAMKLRDAGMEVIYTGLHQTPEQVAQIAQQEDVDVIGISSLADAHRVLAPRVVEESRRRGLNVPVLLGGFVQPEDVPELKKKGITEVFGTDTKLDTIAEYIQKLAKRRHAQ